VADLGDQIKKIFQFFLDDLAYISDLKCIPDLEHIPDNKNVFLILNIHLS